MRFGFKTSIGVAVAIWRDPGLRLNVLRTIKTYRMLPPATCNYCGHIGKFDSYGKVNQQGEECPSCKTKSRHRLFSLAERRGQISFAGKDVLHFAPETSVRDMVCAQKPKSYTTADFEPGRGDLVLNIEDIALQGASFDSIVCLHVLEHVDDRKALLELRRILRPGGELLAMIPVAEGWRETYENPAIRTDAGRHAHFGQRDHVRFFGADVRDRIAEAGFDLEEITNTGAEAARHSMQRGEKIFRCTVPRSTS